MHFYSYYKNAAGQTTYSVIDDVCAKITALWSERRGAIETVVTDLKDGRYSISYTPAISGKFSVAVEVAGSPIIGSPFKLNIRKKMPKKKVKSPIVATRKQGN